MCLSIELRLASLNLFLNYSFSRCFIRSTCVVGTCLCWDPCSLFLFELIICVLENRDCLCFWGLPPKGSVCSLFVEVWSRLLWFMLFLLMMDRLLFFSVCVEFILSFMCKFGFLVRFRWPELLLNWLSIDCCKFFTVVCSSFLLPLLTDKESLLLFFSRLVPSLRLLSSTFYCNFDFLSLSNFISSSSESEMLPERSLSEPGSFYNSILLSLTSENDSEGSS